MSEEARDVEIHAEPSYWIAYVERDGERVGPFAIEGCVSRFEGEKWTVRRGRLCLLMRDGSWVDISSGVRIQGDEEEWLFDSSEDAIGALRSSDPLPSFERCGPCAGSGSLPSMMALCPECGGKGKVMAE